MKASLVLVGCGLLVPVLAVQRPKFKESSWDGADVVSVLISDSGEFDIVNGIRADAEVSAIYADNMDTVGWGQLEVRVTAHSGAAVSDDQRAYAAGVAEGYLTAKRIFQTYENTRVTPYWNFTNGPSPKLRKYIDDQKQFMDEKIAAPWNKDDDFWKYASVLKNQLLGLQYGYNRAVAGYLHYEIPMQYDMWIFTFLNLVGDLFDITLALEEQEAVPDWHDVAEHGSAEAKKLFHQQWLAQGRCSALIRLTPELDDIFISHSSWFTYANGLRIFKRYHFEFNDIQTAATRMAFSSYPGYLESLDDFYLMDSGLAMLQTTNPTPDRSKYSAVTPQSLYAWQRVRIANALSHDGMDWYKYLSRASSSTYNNQYMILNTRLFKPKQPLPTKGLLTIVEQMPGLVAWMDATDILARGYWSSFNVPAIQEIYEQSGFPELVAKLGPEYSYDLAPRARIFRRDAGSIQTFEEFKRLMRYNDYRNDPIENYDPWWAICSRGDLAATGAYPNGCYDTKAANLSMIQSMSAEVINGPSYDDLPVFSWRNWEGIPHEGIKTVMDYPWTKMEAAN